jgi:hypothetical protein
VMNSCAVTRPMTISFVVAGPRSASIGTLRARGGCGCR